MQSNFISYFFWVVQFVLQASLKKNFLITVENQLVRFYIFF